MEQLLKINIPYSREQKHVSVTNWIELVTLGVKNKSRPNELKKKVTWQTHHTFAKSQVTNKKSFIPKNAAC